MSTNIAPQSVLELLDRVEALVNEARRVPLSGNVMVNEEDLMQLIDDARLAMPDDMVQAKRTLDDRKKIIAAAEEEATRLLDRASDDARAMVEEATHRAEALVADAREHAEQLVDDHSITTTARQHADETVRLAEEHAQTISNEADDYAREVMGRLYDQLDKSMSTVRRGLESLPKPRSKRR